MRMEERSISDILSPAKLQDIHNALTDRDGSVRDFNFETPSWEGAAAFLNYLSMNFKITAAVDADGTDLDQPLQASGIAAAKHAHAFIEFQNETSVIRCGQAFVARDDTDRPFVEITVRPDDFRVENLVEDVLTILSTFQNLLGAGRFFCRYENASWKISDPDAELGVFYVSTLEQSVWISKKNDAL